MKAIARRGARRVAVGRARDRLAAARRRRADAGWPRRLLGRGGRRAPGALAPLEVDSETPYLLAYTSGTTGRPKGALHVQGGFLVSIAREVAYQADVHAGRPRSTSSTDMGWIMGPWTVVGGGALGATVVFAEGAPDWPARPALAARRVGARDDARPLADARPRADPDGRAARHDLSSLRAFCTTGEPWNPDPYLWLFEHVGGGARARSSTSRGGTEVGACFLSPVLTEPIKPCSLGFPALGHGHGRRRLATAARCAARSASSSAGGRGPG